MLAGNTSISTPVAPGTYGTSLIAAGENWLGTTDLQDIVFGTSNIERMRIDKTTGSVAIGNSSPNANRTLYSLYTGTTATGAGIWGSASGNAKVYGVFGSISSTTLDAAAIRGISSGASGASVAIYGENQSADGFGVAGINTYGAGAGNLEYGVYGSKQGAAVTGTGYGVYGTATGTGATNIGGYFKANGATNNYGIIVPFGGGIVGINTSAPAGSYLYVTSSNNALDAIDAFHTSGTVGSAFNAVAGDIANGAYIHATGYLGYHSTGNKTFSVYGNGGDLAGMFNGKTGVNSVFTRITPYDLEIRNTSVGNPVNMILRRTTSQTTIGDVLTNLDFGDDSKDDSLQARIQVIRDAAGATPGDHPTALLFYTTADGAATLSERMRIDNSGNVGIGTGAPNSTLHVNGAYQGKVRTVTGTTALLNTDWFVLVNDNSTSTLTLPVLTAGTTDGKTLIIRSASSTTLTTIAAAAGNTLDLGFGVNPLNNGNAITLISSGTVWYVVAKE
jgi:hypothetical protein